MKSILNTGQDRCYNADGHEIQCRDSGQDGEYRPGTLWPESRFSLDDHTVIDRVTGLVWSRDANPHEFPVTWQEALDSVEGMNRESFLGFSDWRLPNRNELRSLISYQTKKPALPADHPFVNVFLGWYWTSTTADINPAYAWYIHMEGARMFYGRKDQYSLFWPVRGKGSSILPRTGRQDCYDISGNKTSPAESSQDGNFQYGVPWPEPRFERNDKTVRDLLTDLTWATEADITGGAVTWEEALAAVRELNEKGFAGIDSWRLPTINELVSLTDCSSHNPALPAGHPFSSLREGYWSSTTSFFETDWAWVLYMTKGACGVGHKPGKTFFVWPVHGK